MRKSRQVLFECGNKQTKEKHLPKEEENLNVHRVLDGTWEGRKEGTTISSGSCFISMDNTSKQNKNQRVQLASLLPQRPTFSFISIHYAIFGLMSPRKSVGYQRVLFKITFSLLQNILFAFPWA